LLTASKENLRHRLTSRTKNNFARTQDVQEWIFSWKDWFENEVKKFNPVIIVNNHDIDNVVNEIIQIGKS